MVAVAQLELKLDDLNGPRAAKEPCPKGSFAMLDAFFISPLQKHNGAECRYAFFLAFLPSHSTLFIFESQKQEQNNILIPPFAYNSRQRISDLDRQNSTSTIVQTSSCSSSSASSTALSHASSSSSDSLRPPSVCSTRSRSSSRSSPFLEVPRLKRSRVRSSSVGSGVVVPTPETIDGLSGFRRILRRVG